MRETVYQFMLRLPVKVAVVVAWLVGFVGSIWPERIKSFVGGGALTSGSIQLICIGFLIAAVIYILALWLLKPGKASAEGLAGQTTYGENSPSMGAGGTVFTVVGAQNGITVGQGTVNLNQTRFSLTEEMLEELANGLERSMEVHFYVHRDGKSEDIARKIADYLALRGFKTSTNWSRFSQTPLVMEKVIMVGMGGLPISGGNRMFAGYQTVVVDYTVA